MIQIFGNAPNQISCLTLITFALVMHIHLLLVSDQHSNIFPTLPNKLQSMKFTQIWVKGSKKKKPLLQSILSRKESRSFLCVEVPHFFFSFDEWKRLCALEEVLHHQRLPCNVSTFFLILAYSTQKPYQVILYWTAHCQLPCVFREDVQIKRNQKWVVKIHFDQ